MTLFNTVLLSVAALIFVFIECILEWPRQWIGAQVDLLPALIVYASLTCPFSVVTLLSILGGLAFDSLSANPLGISVLPLFMAAFVIQRYQQLILRTETYAQWMLGMAASGFVPLISLLLIKTTGHHPQVGLGTLWQWFVMTMAGGIATPLLFRIMDRIENLISYQSKPNQSFSPHRQIARGRH